MERFNTLERFRELIQGTDLFHYHWWLGVPEEPFSWAKQLGIPTLVTLHDPKPCALVADYYIVENSQHTKLIANAHGNPVVCIPAGYDPSRVAVKQDYALHDPPRVLQVMAMHGKAAPDAPLIMDRMLPPEVEVHFMGDGFMRPEFERAAGGSKRVVFHGHVADAAQLMRDYDVFFYYSSFDSTACVISEALAAGMPVVAVGLEELSRVLFCNWNGWFARAGYLAGAVQRLLESQEQRERFGREAAMWAPLLASNQHTIVGHKALYEDIERGRAPYWGRNYSGAQISAPGTIFGIPAVVLTRYKQAADAALAGWTGRVLDWYDIGGGCGFGQVIVSHIAPGRVRYNVLDACLDHIGRGMESYPNVFFTAGDCRKLPYLDECADVVTFMEIIEHVREGEQALAEVARILRPGGRVFISTPSQPDDWYEHVRFYTPEQLTAAVEAAGLIVEAVSYQSSDGSFHPENQKYVMMLAARKPHNQEVKTDGGN